MTGIAVMRRAVLAADDWRRCTLGLIQEDINGNDISVGYRRFTNSPTPPIQPLPDAGAFNYSLVKGNEIQFLGCNSSIQQIGFNIVSHVAKDFFGALAIQLADGRWSEFQTSAATWNNGTLLGTSTQVTVWQWFSVPDSEMWVGTSTDPVGAIRAIKILG